MKIRPGEPSSMQIDGRTDRRDEPNSRFSHICWKRLKWRRICWQYFTHV